MVTRSQMCFAAEHQIKHILKQYRDVHAVYFITFRVLDLARKQEGSADSLQS